MLMAMICQQEEFHSFANINASFQRPLGSRPRISGISGRSRRWKVNEIAKLNRKGSAVRGVFDGGKKKEGQRRAGLDFFSEGIIKWAGNYCFPSLPPCPTLITFALVMPKIDFICGIP